MQSSCLFQEELLLTQGCRQCSTRNYTNTHNNYSDDGLWQDAFHKFKEITWGKKKLAGKKVIFGILHLSVCVLA